MDIAGTVIALLITCCYGLYRIERRLTAISQTLGEIRSNIK
jgi:hypothetical protein